MSNFLYKAEDLSFGRVVHVVDGRSGHRVSTARVVSHKPGEDDKPDEVIIRDTSDNLERIMVLLGDGGGLTQGWRVVYDDPMMGEMVYSSSASTHFYQLTPA